MKKIEKIKTWLFLKNLAIYFGIFFLLMLIIDNFFEWFYNDRITRELFIKSIPIVFFKALSIAGIVSLIDNWSRITLVPDNSITARELDAKFRELDFRLSSENDGIRIYRPVKDTRKFRKPVLYVQIDGNMVKIVSRGNLLRILREHFLREGFEVARDA